MSARRPVDDRDSGVFSEREDTMADRSSRPPSVDRHRRPALTDCRCLTTTPLTATPDALARYYARQQGSTRLALPSTLHRWVAPAVAQRRASIGASSGADPCRAARPAVSGAGSPYFFARLQPPEALVRGRRAPRRASGSSESGRLGLKRSPFASCIPMRAERRCRTGSAMWLPQSAARRVRAASSHRGVSFSSE